MLIDFQDRETVQRRSPLRIAHRGGVVTSASPENSLSAIQLAAADGYDLVELDVVVAKDDEPVLFHGIGPQRSLRGTSGGNAPVAAFTSQQLAGIRYDESDERIAMLDEALALCWSLGLGIMLDIKLASGESLRRRGIERIAALITGHGLATAAMCITPDPLVRRVLPREVLFPVPQDVIDRIVAGEAHRLHHTFWFGIPAELPEAAIGPLQKAGALVIPAINRHRYPEDGHESLAREDIRRLLAAGVDGFQIDSVYRSELPARSGE